MEEKPQVFIFLDENKKIIAKGITVKQIDEIVSNILNQNPGFN